MYDKGLGSLSANIGPTSECFKLYIMKVKHVVHWLMHFIYHF